MPTHTISQSYKTAEGTTTSTVDSYTADTDYTIDAIIAASTTNKEIDLALTRANIKSLVMYSDQAIVIKTNSTVASDTITLAAKIQLVWNTDSLFSIPFAGNVTKFFITNSGGVAANIKFRFLANQEV